MVPSFFNSVNKFQCVDYSEGMTSRLSIGEPGFKRIIKVEEQGFYGPYTVGQATHSRRQRRGGTGQYTRSFEDVDMRGGTVGGGGNGFLKSER